MATVKNEYGKQEAVIHILVWAVFFSVPFFLMRSDMDEDMLLHIVKDSWLPMFFYAVLFYINYFDLAKRLSDKEGRLIFVLCNVGLVFSSLVMLQSMRFLFFDRYLDVKPPLQDRHVIPMSFFILKEAMSLLIPIAVAVAIRTTGLWSETAALQRMAEEERLKEELEHLKYQLQPHFFFNAMNGIYALIDINPKRAQAGIFSLSKLMRYMLYESNTERVKLSQEIDFMEQYIQLMKMRCTDKTKVVFDFPKYDLDKEIPPLLFISLIENAFKHGVSTRRETEIKFKLAISEESITFESLNDVIPIANDDRSGSGIGLDNLAKRLNLIYKDHHTFTRESLEDKYRVVLHIELSKK